MSWILGFFGASLSRDRRERLATFHDLPLFRSEGEGHYLAGGGLAETCLHGRGPNSDEWIVAGLGLRRSEDHCLFLTKADWQAILSVADPSFEGIDGHFVVVRRREGEVETFTDPLGVRTLYLAETDGGLAVSTRLDWMAHLSGADEIDFEAFGAHWLTFNQLTTDSFVRGIRRLGPGGRATWIEGNLRIAELPWSPDRSPGGPSFEQSIAAFAHPALYDGQTLSLGLSGGLDSRLLLALRDAAAPSFATHVFGPSTLQDVCVSNAIARGEDLQQTQLHEPAPDAAACLTLLQRHVAHSHAVSPASAVLGLRYFARLHAQGKVMIDGGFGEIGRRQYLNRLLRRDRPSLRRGEAGAILPHLRVHRADVFTADIHAAMMLGACHEIERLWDGMPAVDKTGEENFLDLLGVRTRLPNFFGFAQDLLDEQVVNFMPFAQPSVLQAVFRTALKERRNGRLFRDIIRRRRPALARYPLVKGALTYPFRLPTLPAFAWTKAKGLFSPEALDRRRPVFLERMRPYALDTVHSASLPACYDREKLTTLVEGYYAGEEGKAAAVDWWLAFEVWRASLQKTNL